MKLKNAIIASLAMTLMAGVALADGPVGTWEGQSDQGPFTVVITEAGGAYSGTLESDLAGIVELSDITFAEGELSFVFSFDFSGEEVSIEVGGAIDGDAFDGHIEIPSVGEFPMAMTRAAGPDWAAVVGKWEGETDQGPVTIVITETGGALAGTIETGLGVNDLAGVAFADARLSFTATLDFGGQEVLLEFDGPIKGDDYGAEVQIEGLGEFPIAMTRAKADREQQEEWVEPIDTPEVVLRAVENWGALPSHVRAAIEGLVAGELKKREKAENEDQD